MYNWFISSQTCVFLSFRVDVPSFYFFSNRRRKLSFTIEPVRHLIYFATVPLLLSRFSHSPFLHLSRPVSLLLSLLLLPLVFSFLSCRRGYRPFRRRSRRRRHRRGRTRGRYPPKKEGEEGHPGAETALSRGRSDASFGNRDKTGHGPTSVCASSCGGKTVVDSRAISFSSFIYCSKIASLFCFIRTFFILLPVCIYLLCH